MQKTVLNIAITEKKENIKSDVYQEFFQMQLLILPMNHQCDAPLQKYFCKIW